MKAIIKTGELFVTEYNRGVFGSAKSVTLSSDDAMVFNADYICREIAEMCNGEIIYIEPPVED